MKLLLFLFCAFFSVAPSLPARAIDPGTVTGTLRVGGKTIPLRYAYAHLHDNAEKLLSRPRELRILLTDREIPAEELAGSSFLLPVESLAMEGGVQGILLKMNPAAPQKEVRSILLMKPSEPGRGLKDGPLGSSGGKAAFKKWTMTPQRVVGEVAHREEGMTGFPDMPDITYSLRFSAPLMKEPAITSDLKGQAALNSPQLRVMADGGRAQKSGDLDALRKITSARANRRTETALKLRQGDDTKAMLKQAALETEKAIPRVLRVVVRGDRAVALFPEGQSATFVREGGAWKIDD